MLLYKKRKDQVITDALAEIKSERRGAGRRITPVYALPRGLRPRDRELCSPVGPLSSDHGHRSAQVGLSFRGVASRYGHEQGVQKIQLGQAGCPVLPSQWRVVDRGTKDHVGPLGLAASQGYW